MVDFTKRLAQRATKKRIDPVEIYETLDRSSDKGELRTAQRAILSEWHSAHRGQKDLVIKLHTGQGKTLIGLLLLQSKLNEGIGPAVYLCPNNFLIHQTCLQAKQFGISVCTAEPGLPHEFLNGEQILVTSIQKLFNGLTQFGLGPRSVAVGALLMDDAHACIDAISDAFCIKLPRDSNGYKELLKLFADKLREQGAGTLADIEEGTGTNLLPIPYWSWSSKHHEVVHILSKQKGTDEVKFAWPLLKDNVPHCQAVLSTDGLEIRPYLAPLEKFGSYWKAQTRVFMSATVTNDAFLVKGLRVPASVIESPLTFKNEKWSGEKMVLIPELIDANLNREAIVKEFGEPKARRFGVVALVPSFARTKDWAAYGSRVAKTGTIHDEVSRLQNGSYEYTLVIANRYDGIDLPDNSCRILIFDGKPFSESLIDQYEESCRSSSEITAIRLARTIEQGLGRSVRGEKDYCAIVLIGPSLVAAARASDTRRHLSAQTQAQIKIGTDIANLAKEDLGESATPMECVRSLISQCILRDPGWKEYYIQEMDLVDHDSPRRDVLKIFEKELEAELAFQQTRPRDAQEILQSMLDQAQVDSYDRGWYLQQMARYALGENAQKSNELQVKAHLLNQFLLKPRTGMKIDSIQVISLRRIERIKDWLKSHESAEEMALRMSDVLAKLTFGTTSEKFEAAFHEVGRALGFECQRPDKQWGQGPDNLWGLKDGEFLLVECKSEVNVERYEINKNEAGQMNNSCAWFRRQYPNAVAAKVMIIPAQTLSKAAGFNEEVRIMRVRELKKLVSRVRAFFEALKGYDFRDLDDERLQALINQNELDVDSLSEKYAVPAREPFSEKRE